MIKEMIKDIELPFPNEKYTGAKFKDGLYNWVVGRYKKNNHAWKRSDEIIFGGFIYGVLDYVWLVIWVWAFWLLLNSILTHRGYEQAVLAAILMILVRVNIAIKKLAELNKRFE